MPFAGRLDEALRTEAVAMELPDVAFFELTGEDRTDWLQGQITQDVSSIQSGQAVDACLCKPTGQLLSILRIWAFDDKLVVATREPEPLIQRVETMVILEEVELNRLDVLAWSVQGPAARPIGEIALPHDRTGLGGFDVFERPDLPVLDEDTLALAELEAGLVRIGVDADEKTLPPELGQHFVNQTVHYAKGCYVGQEVLMRIYSRGHTNKTRVGLRSNHPVKVGEAVDHASRAKVGTIARSAVSPRFGPIATAIIRNEAAEIDQMVKVGDIDARVVALPFEEDR